MIFRVVAAFASVTALAVVVAITVFLLDEGNEVDEEVEVVVPGFCGNQPVESRESAFTVRSSLSLAPGSQALMDDSHELQPVAQTAINIEPLEHSEAVDDLVNVPAYGLIEIDILANDINFSAREVWLGRDNWVDNFFLRITVLPKLGEARVIEFPGEWLYRVIEYNNFSSGCDYFEYEVCNNIIICDTGKVYINAGLEDCTILGTEGDDHLIGTPGDDIICGLAGDDVIDGMSGNDIILGGTGNDMIFGGGGDDRILGEIGNDRIQGGLGENLISGGADSDLVDGNKGYDRYRWKERTLLTR